MANSKPSKTAKIDMSMERLASIMLECTRIPETMALLRLANKLDCKIIFDPNIPKGVGGAFRFDAVHVEEQNGQMVTEVGKPVIRLNPKCSDDILPVYLAHELRHLWQSTRCDYFIRKGHQTPREALVYMRMVEGDAVTFQNYIAARLKDIRSGSKTRRSFNWAADFWAFQKNPERGSSYDADALRITGELVTGLCRETKDLPPDEVHHLMKLVFNGAAQKDVKSTRKIFMAGTGKNSINYLLSLSDEALLKGIQKEISANMLARAEKIQKTIDNPRKKRA